MKFRNTRILLMFLMLFSGSFSVVSAHDEKDSFTSKDDMSATSNELIQSRNYVGGFLSYMTITNGGDIDGNVFGISLSPYELDLVPGINSNFGFGAFLGRREGDFALEAGYSQSQHSAYWGVGTPFSSTGTASYQSVDINFKRYLFTEQQMQPFILAGLALPWVTYPLASTDGLGNFSSFCISGVGFNLGGGVEFYFDDSFSIFGTVFQRWNKFDTSVGYRDIDWALSLEGDGVNVTSGATMSL